MTVSEALLDILADYGVKHIFGIPGDAINELLEAIRKQNRIKFIHVMHEETGAFAASAQAKLTGQLAVCAGTAGPGAIHLLNGLYDAKMDHAPVLAITGQVQTSMLGTAYHQEVDLHALYADVAEFNQTIYDPAQMPELATLAVQTAISRKCVSHLSIPSNIATLKVPDYKKQKQVLSNTFSILPVQKDVQNAAEIINKSKKPCILAGIGAKGAVEELLQIAALIKSPIIKALRGKDLLSDIHPLVVGGIGLLGTEPALKASKDCDLFIVIGSDFPYQDFYPESKIPTIQIDNQTLQIGRRHKANLSLIGDAKATLMLLLPLLENKTDDSFLREAQKNMEGWLQKQDKMELSSENPIHPQALARKIGEHLDNNAVITCDTGSVTVWAARNFRLKQGQLFTLSGGLASMAFALPAAIGAKLSFPDKEVVAFCGDGGFAMLMCDFATAVKYNLNIKIFIFNNSKLGMIQMEQEASGHPEYKTHLNNPDYASFAIGCGGAGFTVDRMEDLEITIRKALDSPKPAIVNVYVNPGEITWPPKVTISEAINFTKAKLTEYFLEK
jgi:thiamine pyrophosphate-dependent acetolactate synthase large subunit-like protein